MTEIRNREVDLIRLKYRIKYFILGIHCILTAIIGRKDIPSNKFTDVYEWTAEDEAEYQEAIKYDWKYQ